MKPSQIEQIGNELAIRWENGEESYIGLEVLRRHCPCAACRGEVDIFGKLYRGPEQSLAPQAFELRRVDRVGGYGLQPAWGDGHTTGIYSFEYLKQLADGTEPLLGS